MEWSKRFKRVLRGGSWLNARDYRRAAARGRLNPGLRLNGLSFRLVGVEDEVS